MTVIPQDRMVPVNSTSYIDLLAINVGLERLPGEDAAEFADRIDLAISADRGRGYVGAVNSLALELGLEMRPAIRIEGEGLSDCKVRFGELILDNHTISLVSMSSDDFWEWKSLSAVAWEICSIEGYLGTLEGEDGPALQLVKQSNTPLVAGETVTGEKSQRLAHGPVVAGSLRFSQAVPGYTVSADGRTLHFTVPPAEGITATYRYRVSPYSLIASPAALVSLSDPLVRAKAKGSNGKLIYQFREYVQEILRRDGSYWGK